jgi:hypothetical protein
MRPKVSVEDVKFIIENEGIGYAIQHYLPYGDIEDNQLSLMWKNAEQILNSIEDYVGV